MMEVIQILDLGSFKRTYFQEFQKLYLKSYASLTFEQALWHSIHCRAQYWFWALLRTNQMSRILLRIV